MRQVLFFISGLLAGFAAAAQYGDAYHAPDNYRLQQMRTQREAEMKRSSSYNRNAPSSNNSSVNNTTAQRNTTTTKKAEPSYNDKLIQAFDEKMRRFNELSKGIAHTPANFEQLVRLAVAAGMDEYTARRTLGYINPANTATLRNNNVGYTYKGNTKDGQPFGRGTFTFDNGDELTTDIVDGIPHGKGIMKWKNGAVYEGDIQQGDLTGIGTITDPNGKKYSGRFEKSQLVEQRTGDIKSMNGPKTGGKYNGDEVTVEWTSGERFRGKVVNDVPVNGRIEYPDGYVFEGSFKTINDWTEGKLTTPEGTSFEGTFRNNVRQYGKYTYANGNTLTGRFAEDGKSLRCGLYVSPKYSYEGEFAKGNKKQGYGKTVQKNGDVYEGEYINDLEEGRGSFAFKNTKVTGKLFFKNSMVYGMAMVNGKLQPARLNKDYTVGYLPEAEAAEAKQFYEEALKFIGERKAAYEACVKEGAPLAKKTEAGPEKKQQAVQPAAEKKPQAVTEKTVVPEERRPTVVTKTYPADVNNQVNFSGWDEAVAKLSWENIKRPQEDDGSMLMQGENILLYSQQKAGYWFTTAPLGKTALPAWTYKATFELYETIGDETEFGLVLKTENEGGTAAPLLLFMVNASEQEYALHTWSKQKAMGVPLIHANTYDGGVVSKTIAKFDGVNASKNSLSLIRKGDLLQLVINDKLVETIRISTSYKSLTKLTGIGIVSLNKGNVQISQTSFTQRAQ